MEACTAREVGRTRSSTARVVVLQEAVAFVETAANKVTMANVMMTIDVATARGLCVPPRLRWSHMLPAPQRRAPVPLPRRKSGWMSLA